MMPVSKCAVSLKWKATALIISMLFLMKFPQRVNSVSGFSDVSILTEEFRRSIMRFMRIYMILKQEKKFEHALTFLGKSDIIAA